MCKVNSVALVKEKTPHTTEGTFVICLYYGYIYRYAAVSSELTWPLVRHN